MTEKSKSKPTVIDLFCGCGGLSYGFIQAGYEMLLGIDNDSVALTTFEKNHGNTEVLNEDISSQNIVDKIKSLIRDREIDVIIAGPPCQGFSLTGPRNFDDERNRLYLAVIRIVKELSPKAFLIENVPGMATLYSGQIKKDCWKAIIQLVMLRIPNKSVHFLQKVLWDHIFGTESVFPMKLVSPVRILKDMVGHT